MKEENKYNPSLIPFAKELRKNLTPEERKLWYEFLHNYPIKFTRQKIAGKYILDFYCSKVGLAIELDGSQHYKEDAVNYDKERTAYLNGLGIEVIRFLNRDISDNFYNVCKCIDSQVNKRLNELNRK